MKADEQVYAYRALCEHGKVRGLVVDPNTPDCANHAKELRKSLAEFVRWGYTVERVTVEEARKSDMNCAPCDEKFAKPKKSPKKKAEQPAPPMFGD